MKLYSETIGNPSEKPVIVLLHGWGANSSIWSDLVDYLDGAFSLRLIDLPGLGRSEALENPNRESLANTLSDAVSDLSEFHLVGWSLGGMAGIDLAERLPDKVKSLTLLASNPCFIQQADWPMAMALETYDAFKATLISSESKALGRFALLQTRGSQSAKSELNAIKQMLSETNATALLPMLEMLEHDYRCQFSNLSCPVFCCLGDQDVLVPVEVAHELTKLADRVQIAVYQGASHLPFLTYPERCARDISNFAELANG